MTQKEELYVSFSPEKYRMGKTGVLQCQADLLDVMKRINNIKILTAQKNDLKRRVHKLMGSVASDVGSIQEKMPHPKVPKSVEEKEEKTSKGHIKEFSRKDEIEDELKAIREKLRELNA